MQIKQSRKSTRSVNPRTLTSIAMLVVSLGMAQPFAMIADELARPAMISQAPSLLLSSPTPAASNQSSSLVDPADMTPGSSATSPATSNQDMIHESDRTTSPTQTESAAIIPAETTVHMPSDATLPTTAETVTSSDTETSSLSETTTESSTQPTPTTTRATTETRAADTPTTAKPTTDATTTTTQPTTEATIATTRPTTNATSATTQPSTTATTQPTTTATTEAAQPTPTTTEPDRTAQAAELHANAFVIDTHCDTLLDIVDRNTWLPIMNIGRATSSMIDIPKMQKGGIDLQVFAAYTSGYALAGGGQDFAKANSRLLSLINGLKWTLAKNTSTLHAVTNLNDVRASVPAGKIGVLSSIEGAYSLNKETGIELLRQYADLGVRMLAPTWSNSNALGEGVNDAYKDGTASSGGLTELGKAVIIEMNRLGMVVDVSHMNDATFWETMAATTSPVIASHSCVYRLNNNVRNLKDEQIIAIAKGGGVIQVNFHRPFLALDPATVTIETLVDHIDSIVDLVGIDSVGLGSDFDGAKMPDGLEDASLMPRITLELVNRGYDDDEIRKILGANSARLFRDVWQRASVIRSSKDAPAITVPLSMGARLETATPVLTAVIQAGEGHELDTSSIRLIVDGQVLQPAYDEATATASLALTAPLTEQFHVITFLAANLSGETTRATRICFIDQP